ncbi:pyridoxamine 5'-phosphate oxidase family protein [Dactylosporangium sp. AC04546]|uniref:pyridoxamine 5'-phosphate oxidase family protein n=1 Tax=Dactylosporangium sp. AC04546 TaxID=2862460 RepID=UPI001EE0FAB8|nr:pyridoxamine 5'-phosphate oxidase family protein [Dactylosporangium sp. AC04546]WVK86099.1 pyridoxamine 5'-phosphate oxidase family protein [Dactylosporangium sp. AC04546]
MWWNEFADAEPDLAARVEARFKAARHSTMATLRRDGSPRISGTEVEFGADGMVLGSMAGSLKARDLHRDPRVALHSPSVDPDDDAPATWPGDAKVAGTAHEVVVDPAPEDGSHRFRVDVAEVVLTYVAPSADHLVVESWHPDRGRETRMRK